MRLFCNFSSCWGQFVGETGLVLFWTKIKAEKAEHQLCDTFFSVLDDLNRSNNVRNTCQEEMHKCFARDYSPAIRTWNFLTACCRCHRRMKIAVVGGSGRINIKNNCSDLSLYTNLFIVKNYLF